jgi:hypothetical protein
MLWWVVFINESPLHDLHWVLFDYWLTVSSPAFWCEESCSVLSIVGRKSEKARRDEVCCRWILLKKTGCFCFPTYQTQLKQQRYHRFIFAKL